MLIFKKENEVRKLVLKHLSTVQECLETMRKVLLEYTSAHDESAYELARQVKRIESRADHLEKKIREALLSGAFLPNLRSDVYRLVEAVDAIAGKAEDVAFFILAQRPRIPAEQVAAMLEVCARSLDCFYELRKGLHDFFKPRGKIEALHHHVARVCEIETEVDKLELAFALSVFESESLGLDEKIHLERLMRLIADLADHSEDAADELEFAAMKAVI